MNKVNNSLYSRIESINQTLQGNLSLKKVTELTQELDQTLKQKATNIFDRASLQNPITDLYEKLQSKEISIKISQISEEAHLIESSLKTGPISNVALNLLNQHINQLFKHYCPSINERKEISYAQRTLQEARYYLKNPNKKMIDHFEWLSKQPPTLNLILSDSIESGEFEELFDIAAFVYDGKMKEAKLRFTKLPEQQKDSVKGLLRDLAGVGFEDALETIQALLGTAHKLVGNDHIYLTQTEIDDIFLGLKNTLASSII